jgi:hypothetical protein
MACSSAVSRIGGMGYVVSLLDGVNEVRPRTYFLHGKLAV